MKVFKFGGASVKDTSSVKNVYDIISTFRNEKLLIVISAMGKTTNALEDVVQCYYDKQDEVAHQRIREIEAFHTGIAKALFPDDRHPVYEDLSELFRELYDISKFIRTDVYNFLYDQVICFGELFSTKIVAHYLISRGLNAHWLDARSVIKTDKTFREARVNFEVTNSLIKDTVTVRLQDKIIITPGFIGSTPSNHTTSLGREGSDYTAAIFASALEVNELVIWKDVAGVLNADPKLFPDAVMLSHISYREAVEMTYYGAQVIHPRTIKPLENKSIPLRVRSFIHRDREGTVIDNKETAEKLPPVIVYKRNQMLLELTTIDFSFMAEDNLSLIYDTFARLNFRVNLMQTAAISLQLCIDTTNKPKLAELLDSLEPYFQVKKKDNVEVLTIRHFTEEIMQRLTEGRSLLITQKGRDTVQFVLEV